MKKKYSFRNLPFVFPAAQNNNSGSRYPVLLLFIFGICLCLSSCKYSNSPESVARRFLVSFNQLDFATAKSLSTPNTWQILDIMAEATKNISQDRKDAFSRNFTVKIIQTEKESDTSRIITFQTIPKRLPFNKIRLVRTFNKDGNVRWKVDISTLDLLDSEKPQLTPPEVLDDSLLNENDSIGLPDSLKD